MARPDPATHEHVPAEKERALRALVLADGKPSKAREALAADGQDTPIRTIQEWRNTYAARYDWLKRNQRQWVSKEIAARSRRSGQQVGSAGARIAQTIDSMSAEEIEKLTVGSRANAVKALAAAQAIFFSQAESMDKAAASHVEESEEDMGAIVRGLARFFKENKLTAEVPAELTGENDNEGD